MKMMTILEGKLIKMVMDKRSSLKMVQVISSSKLQIEISMILIMMIWSLKMRWMKKRKILSFNHKEKVELKVGHHCIQVT